MVNDLEKKLIKKVIKGNDEAFEKLVYKYEKKIYNIAYHILGNEQDAYDVSQEIFLKIYSNIHKFKFNSSFSTWIHRIAVNTCIDEYRKNVRRKTFSLDESVNLEDSSISRQLADDALPIDYNLIQKETVNEIRKAIEMLNIDHKTVIVLRDIKGYSYEEIAEIINCNIGTVKSRISRARQALKNILSKNEEQNSVLNVK